MFQLDDVSVRLGREWALRNCSFSLEEKKIIGVAGPDGAGKTTLLKCLVGLVQPSKGTIQKRNIKISFVPEHFSLYEDLSIQENLSFYGSLYGLEKALIEERSQELLRWVRLDSFADRLAGNLSGGMKRKLSIITAVLQQPDVLIIDEPTHGIDPLSRREIWALIKELHQQGTMIIASTPYLDEMKHCNEVLLLHRGNLLQKATPSELLQQFPYDVFRLVETRKQSWKELQSIKQLPGVVDFFLRGVDGILFSEKGRFQAPELQQMLSEHGITQELELYEPIFEDVFISLMQEKGVIT